MEAMLDQEYNEVINLIDQLIDHNKKKIKIFDVNNMSLEELKNVHYENNSANMNIHQLNKLKMTICSFFSLKNTYYNEQLLSFVNFLEKILISKSTLVLAKKCTNEQDVLERLRLFSLSDKIRDFIDVSNINYENNIFLFDISMMKLFIDTLNIEDVDFNENEIVINFTKNNQVFVFIISINKSAKEYDFIVNYQLISESKMIESFDNIILNNYDLFNLKIEKFKELASELINSNQINIPKNAAYEDINNPIYFLIKDNDFYDMKSIDMLEYLDFMPFHKFNWYD